MTTIDDPGLAKRREETSEPDAEVTLAFDNNKYAALVFGLYDQNLAKIERRLRVASFANGNHVTLKGKPEACDHARRVLEALYDRIARGQNVTPGDVDGAIEETARQRSLFPNAEPSRGAFEQVITRRRGLVRARNAAQDQYLRALKRYELVFGVGPAGTGKTWLAVAHAVQLMEQGAVERLILSRPAV